MNLGSLPILYSEFCSSVRNCALFRVFTETIFSKVNPSAQVPIVEQYVVAGVKQVSTESSSSSTVQEWAITDLDLSSFFPILCRSVDVKIPLVTGPRFIVAQQSLILVKSEHILL